MILPAQAVLGRGLANAWAELVTALAGWGRGRRGEGEEFLRDPRTKELLCESSRSCELLVHTPNPQTSIGTRPFGHLTDLTPEKVLRM